MAPSSSPAQPKVSKVYIRPLLKKLSNARDADSSRDPAFYGELKKFIDKCKLPNGARASDFVDKNRPEHMAGLSEAIGQFFQQPKEHYQSLGHYFWPDNSSPDKIWLQYSTDKDEIQKLLTQLCCCRNAQQQKNKEQRNKKQHLQTRARTSSRHILKKPEDTVPQPTAESLTTPPPDQAQANAAVSTPRHGLQETATDKTSQGTPGREGTPDSVFPYDFSTPRPASVNRRAPTAPMTGQKENTPRQTVLQSLTHSPHPLPSSSREQAVPDTPASSGSGTSAPLAASKTQQAADSPAATGRVPAPDPERQPSIDLPEVPVPRHYFPSPEVSSFPHRRVAAVAIQPLRAAVDSNTVDSAVPSIETPLKNRQPPSSSPLRPRIGATSNIVWRGVRYFIKQRVGFPVEWEHSEPFPEISFAGFMKELSSNPDHGVDGDVDEIQVFLEGTGNPMGTPVRSERDFSALKAIFAHEIRMSRAGFGAFQGHDGQPIFLLIEPVVASSSGVQREGSEEVMADD